MGLKKFLVSKYGALTAGIFGVGAGAGTNVAMAQGLKEGLAEEARDEFLLDFAADLGVTNMTPEEISATLYYEGHTLNIPEALQALNDADLAGKAAELTAHWQPSTIAGTAAVCGTILVGYCVARHFAKKSLNSEMVR